MRKKNGEKKKRRKCASSMTATCPPGYGRRGKTCELCPASTYGRGQCLPCPPNTYSLKAGSAYCRPCPPGAYVGTQCHPTDSALELSMVGLVMKHGFFTAGSLSVLIGCALFWLKTRRNSRSKAVPFSPLASSVSEALLSSRGHSRGSLDALSESSSESDSDAYEEACSSLRAATSKVSSAKSKVRSRTTEGDGQDGWEDADDDEGEKSAGSDDSGVVGDGAGGDASPRKRQQILERLKEHGAVLPVAGVDINEISEKAKQFRARPTHM